MHLAEPAESKPVYYPLPVLEEESEEKIKERIKIDEYLLSSERDDYKRAELYMSLSLSYFKLGDFERGEEYLQKSNDIRAKLKDKRGIFLNYGRLSSLFILKGDFKKVIDICNEALKVEPNFVVFYTRGYAYAELNKYEQAIEDFSKAIELNPALAKAYSNRGIAYSEIHRYEESARDLKKAGILFLHSGRGEDAVKAFSICFKLWDKIENDDIVYCGLALSLLTSDADVMNELRGVRIQDENLRIILELAMRKLRNEDISEEISVLEEKEKREEMMLLLELLKKL